MSKALGVIPARWASSRFPGKPLFPIAGKPLLRHVWEQARRAKRLDHLIIATDNFHIAEAAFSWGAEVALTAKNHSSGTDRAAEVARKASQFAHIINIQGDEPLIDPKLIDRLVSELRKDRKLEMITAAHPFDNPRDAASPHQVKVVLDSKRFALYFSRARIPADPGDADVRRQLPSDIRAFTVIPVICCSGSSGGGNRRSNGRNRSSNCAR